MTSYYEPERIDPNIINKYLFNLKMTDFMKVRNLKMSRRGEIRFFEKTRHLFTIMMTASIQKLQNLTTLLMRQKTFIKIMKIIIEIIMIIRNLQLS